MAAETTTKTTKTVEEMQSFWLDAATQNAERVSQMLDEWAKLEKKATVQASNAVDEMAKMMKASIDYMTQINDQFRDLTVESMKKTAKR